MTAIEAMIYCLKTPSHIEYGNLVSARVFDRNGKAHWFAWNGNLNGGWPFMYSDDKTWAFSMGYAPYTVDKTNTTENSK